ncbi:MAG TPA: DUF3500 domain-containing protein [Acidobacteriota bacterium]|nr:DUF3500 domain-containing protein [Acidobacteriota bacterium]
MRNLMGMVAVVGIAASAGGYALGRSPAMQGGGEAAALAEPFRGITVDGSVVADLFPLRATGVSTAPVVAAAAAFLNTLDTEQRRETTFAVDDVEWRRWNNVHRYDRRGVSFGDMSEAQRTAAYGLLGAGLSAKGLRRARDIMRLNTTVAELVNNFEEYGEGLYFFTVMGAPSESEPWGWQLDGHHLVINYFVLGDQVVMTPTFLGSEPTYAAGGKYASTRVFQDEEARGLALMQSLSAELQTMAMIADELPRNVFTAAFRDNFEMRFEGIRANALDDRQRGLLIDLIAEYVGDMRDEHAAVRMEEARQHLDDTWFGWAGATDDDAVFYYRVHSPVILIEFDHQRPIALEGDAPSRNHVHAVVRTPNGNDYGKDLLRQHHELFDHTHEGTH